MEKRTKKIVAVLTGDIVGSTTPKGKEEKSWPEKLQETYEFAQPYREEALPYPIDAFRGDGWQILVEEPGVALWVAALMRARLLETVEQDTRVAIALGSVTRVSKARVSQSSGDAFTRSGQRLDMMGSKRSDPRLACDLPATGDAGKDQLYRIAASSLMSAVDLAATNWTQAQAQAIARMLTHHFSGKVKQADIARDWQPKPIKQATVSEHLHKGGWNTIDRALGDFEHLVRLLRDDVEGAA